MRGRTVMVYDRPDGELVQVFQVGVEDMHGVIKALLERRPDLDALHIIDRTDSFFARTVPASTDPARLYVGIAAQGKGPKLVFLHALTTLLAAAQAEATGEAGTTATDTYPDGPLLL